MTNPLDLPPVPSIWLTDYRDEPGYPIPPRDVASGYDQASRVLARLGLTPAGKAA